MSHSARGARGRVRTALWEAVVAPAAACAALMIPAVACAAVGWVRRGPPSHWPGLLELMLDGVGVEATVLADDPDAQRAALLFSVAVGVGSWAAARWTRIRRARDGPTWSGSARAGVAAAGLAVACVVILLHVAVTHWAYPRQPWKRGLAAASTDERLVLGARHGACDVVEAALVAGASADAVAAGPAGNHALHLAAALPDAGVVQLLLSAGANPAATNSTGRTPLFCAAAAVRPENVRCLLDAGANPRTTDAQGNTAADVVATDPARRTASAGEVQQVVALLATDKSPPPQ